MKGLRLRLKLTAHPVRACRHGRTPDCAAKTVPEATRYAYRARLANRSTRYPHMLMMLVHHAELISPQTLSAFWAPILEVVSPALYRSRWGLIVLASKGFNHAF